MNLLFVRLFVNLVRKNVNTELCLLNGEKWFYKTRTSDLRIFKR